MDRQDIIVAPATPPGVGGVAIVRLSGQGCLDLSRRFFRPSSKQDIPNTHTFYHGFLYDDHGCLVDEVMYVYMACPRSFTAEDVVEIHCHGGHQTVAAVMRVFLQAGARIAQPGEFSYRAFLNGRIDLAQAEAIADLIHAKSQTAHTLALSQAEGQLSRLLYNDTTKIRDALALVEAWIDFPEEELPAEDISKICHQVRDLIVQLRTMAHSYNTGRLYMEGASLLLLGKPNVGKSSLMNALLGEERAIVTDMEGTTRDLLEEGLVINGLPVRLIDAAGLRESTDPIERVGVERARKKIASTDLVLLLFDGSRSFDDDDFSAFESCRGTRFLTVITKSDLLPVCELPTEIKSSAVSVSIKKDSDLLDLRQRIFETLVVDETRADSSTLLTSQRHQSSALLAIDCLERFLSAAEQSFSLEFLASDLRESLRALGEITGETTSDEILDAIFSRFCIGK